MADSAVEWAFTPGSMDITFHSLKKDRNVVLSWHLCAGVKNLSTSKSNCVICFVLLLDLKACCPVDYNK